MIHSERIQPPEDIYPIDEWRIVETRFHPPFIPTMESLCAMSNGYLGMRGCFEEGNPAHEHGTFVNGFHETWPIVYGENAYGFAKTGQTMVNAPESYIIRLFVDDEPLYLPTANLLEFERDFNMRTGTLNRTLLWEMPSGKQVRLTTTRLVSFTSRHLAAMRYSVTIENDSAPVAISSELTDYASTVEVDDDPRKATTLEHTAMVSQFHSCEDQRFLLGYQTQNSGMTLACGIDHVVEYSGKYDTAISCTKEGGNAVYTFDAEQGDTFTVTKYMSYHTSRSTPAEKLAARTSRTLDRAKRNGFASLLKSQKEYLDTFWHHSDIVIEASADAKNDTEALLQAVRFNIFHLGQATGRAEGVGVPAKGLTGQAYEGHYFWDLEIYVLPFLIYTDPQAARNLLLFRHSMLPKARERAAELHHRGAMFPWRTINGDEASAYYAAGTAQYHINADIAYSVTKYATASGDTDFLHGAGAEILVETARLWADVGHYSERRDGQYCICGVTGPDEYNTVVDNNLFTNLMARANLNNAADVVDTIREQDKAAYKRLRAATGLDYREVKTWRKAADAMYIPFDEKLGIHPQDDSFLDKRPWDFKNTPKENYPLLLNYHPLTIYRHQVIKQADTVLAMLLLSRDFTQNEKLKNFKFYDPLTTGDSSLSVGIQAILAAEMGLIDKALEYSRYAILMDLGDVSGNVADGCHIASMGAAWMAFIHGFAGLRDDGGTISFDPRPPSVMKRVQFRLCIKGEVLRLVLQSSTAKYTLETDGVLDFLHMGQEVSLTKDKPSATLDAPMLKVTT